MVNRSIAIAKLKDSSNSLALKNINFDDLFPNSSSSMFGGINSIFDIFKNNSDLLSILASLQNAYVQRDMIYIKGRARETNEYVKYLQPYDENIKKLAMTIVDAGDSSDVKMYKIEQWVLNNIPYEFDYITYGQDEYWATPSETLRNGQGDCIANYEEIWTKNGLEKVGDLKIGQLVLSYDFSKQKYCYKPITKIWEKGKLPVFRVAFRNGTWVDVTEDHPFWTRRTQKSTPYVKTKLKDIDLTRWWKRKVPCVKKLPYKIEDINWLTEDLCFVIGNFLAEGENGSHVRTSGYDIPKHIIPILKKYRIPFSISTNSNNVPYLTFLKSDFKKYLKRFKKNSFDIHIPNEIFNLPKNKLKALIDGHFLGDGHFSIYAENSHKEKTYSTSSYQLAYDLQRIHLQLGTPIYMWLQMDHKGAGNKPIWRLSYNTNSAFSRDFGYKDISEVSIKNYEYIGEKEVRDFEVGDTHTFISKFGNIIHQCEDLAFLIHSLGLNAGIDSNRLRTYGGVVAWQNENGGLSAGGHGWTAYKTETTDRWLLLDGSFFTTDKPFNERIQMKDNFKYVDDYFFVNLKNTVDTPYSNGIRNPEIHQGYGDSAYKGNIFNKYI